MPPEEEAAPLVEGSESAPQPNTHTPLWCLPVEGSGQAYEQFWLPDAYLVPFASILGGNNQVKKRK